MIIINTKNYRTGNALRALVKSINSYDVHTIIAVPAPDIALLAEEMQLNVYAQHVDYIEHEKSTGSVSAASLKKAGATGTLLNHSEKRLPFDTLKKTIEQCKKAGLATVVCAKSLSEAQKIAQLKPSAIAFEDPALIGTGRSITSAKANTLKKFVADLKGKPTLPLCGAGISSIEDVQAAYALGCKGVLIASAIAQTKSPSFFLEKLAQWQQRL